MEKITYDDEIWKPVVGWEGFYEVSNKGRIRSVTLGKDFITSIFVLFNVI